MKSTKVFLLLLLSALLFISCGKKENEIKKEIEIKGDVFIATKGAGNYKLGLVEVTAIPENVIQLYINDKKVQRTDAILQRRNTTTYESAETYFNDINFPQGIAAAMTDAEGKFILKLPKPGKYALAARAKRSLIDKTEEYNWLVWINADGKTASIMLSNNNLTNSGSLDSLIETW